MVKKADGSSYYYHADGLGSITALSDNTGEIIETIEYQAYGKPVLKDASGTVIAMSAIGNIYSYTSREYDYETGMFFYRARFYSAEKGRFLQQDPVGFNGGINQYIYALDTPLNWGDPFGLQVTLGDVLDPTPFKNAWNNGYYECYGKCMVGPAGSLQVLEIMR